MKAKINTEPVQKIMLYEKGYRFIQDRNSNIDQFYDVWKGNSNWRDYKVFLPDGTFREAKMLTMNLPKHIARTWADNFANENIKIAINNETTNVRIIELLKKEKFYSKINNFVEMYMALGIGAIVVDTDQYISYSKDYAESLRGKRMKGGNVKLYFVGGVNIVPITIDSGVVTECAFYSFTTNTSTIKIHFKDKDTGLYKIAIVHGVANKAGEYHYDDHYEIQELNSEIPMFTIWHPNITDDCDIDNSVGTSIFDSAMDSFQQCDLDYTALYKEIDLGKKVKFIRSGLIQRDADGVKKNLFDVNDESILEIPDEQMGNIDMKEFNGELRVAQIINSINFNMNIATMLCGLGTNMFELDSSTGRPLQTATAVKMKSQTLAKNVKKQENFSSDEIKSLIQAICWLNNTWTKNPEIPMVDVNDINVDYEDNIIDDDQSKKAAELQEVSAGTLTVAEFRSHWYGESLEEAQTFVHDNALLLDKYLTAYQSDAIDEETFVTLVFGENYANKNTLIQALKDKKTMDVPMNFE